MTPTTKDRTGTMTTTSEVKPLRLPYSEVCCHMKVAGAVMRGRLCEGGRSVQLLTDDGRSFSFPITRGEAGWDLPENRAGYADGGGGADGPEGTRPGEGTGSTRSRPGSDENGTDAVPVSTRARDPLVEIETRTVGPPGTRGPLTPSQEGSNGCSTEPGEGSAPGRQQPSPSPVCEHRCPRCGTRWRHTPHRIVACVNPAYARCPTCLVESADVDAAAVLRGDLGDD